MADVTPRYETFRALHTSGCFVIPNPWDAGSARFLQHLGFKALATTSAGIAFACGVPDGAVERDEMLARIYEIVTATDLPVNADFGRAFADQPEAVARNVKACVATGVAGLSVEDATEQENSPLYEFAQAVDRIKAARAAIDETGAGVLLTGRAECYLVNHPEPFQESIRRLKAYAEAGADVLYAPGVTERDEIRAMVVAVAPKPVNILVSSDTGLRISDLAEMGVRRVSVGSSMARTAWTGFARAAKEIAESGTFEGFRDLMPFGELNGLFKKDSSTESRG